MANLIVVNNDRCRECGQATLWRWRIEMVYSLDVITISFGFKYSTQETAIAGGKSFAQEYSIPIAKIDKRLKNIDKNKA